MDGFEYSRTSCIDIILLVLAVIPCASCRLFMPRVLVWCLSYNKYTFSYSHGFVAYYLANEPQLVHLAPEWSALLVT